MLVERLSREDAIDLFSNPTADRAATALRLISSVRLINGEGRDVDEATLAARVREVCDDPVVRRAFARRDITTVYRRLVEAGLNQRQIAQRSGQRPSEVSEIISGRAVQAVAVLERIADGLGIPRGWMGLAYTAGSGVLDPILEDDDVRRRRFLGSASLALLGAVAVGEAGGLPLLTGERTGALGSRDVPWITDLTARLRELALVQGGGSIYAAARGSASSVMGALRETADPSRELLLAASGLCRIAGWSAFDAGYRPEFWQAHATALDLAREAAHPPAVTTIIEYAGRAEIHEGAHRQAAKLFELVSLRRESDAVGWGLLGSAYAPHAPDAARAALARGRDAEGSDTPDAVSMRGHVSADIGDNETAVAAYTAVLPLRSGLLAVLDLAPLAATYLRAGEVGVGVQHAERALALAAPLRSAACTEALHRLGTALAGVHDSTAQDLAVQALLVRANAV